MPVDLAKRIKVLQSKARGDRTPLPLCDVTDVFKITWLEPVAKNFARFDELDDVKNELPGWLPIGKADGQCLMAAVKAPHRVAVFSDGFQPVADSLDEFFTKVVLAKGEKSPGQLLTTAIEKAESKLEANKAKDAIALLRPVLASYMSAPDPDRENLGDLEELVASAWHTLGMAEHEAGDDARSLEAYQTSLKWDDANMHAAANVMRIQLDRKEHDTVIEASKKLLARWKRKVPIDEEATVRALRFLAIARTGKVANAHRDLATWASKADKSERTATKKVMVEELSEEADVAGELAAIKRALS